MFLQLPDSLVGDLDHKLRLILTLLDGQDCVSSLLESIPDLLLVLQPAIGDLHRGQHERHGHGHKRLTISGTVA
jgi:hypothetical protein